jgi:glycosyltransferase involved in cell wall biosynthesis
MTMSGARAPVAVIVLTLNEEANLEACLASVAGWTSELFVVDSGSTDRTLDIASRHGARVVTHPFESHVGQWEWALGALPVTAPWILALDADQRVSDQLRTSIERVCGEPGGSFAGFYVNRRQVFRGRWIRHGGYYPKYLLKLFGRGRGRPDPADLVDHHFRVDGGVARLDGDLIEDNRNEMRIADWIAKHNRYARLQAQEELTRLADDRDRGRVFGHPDERVVWLKRRWRRMPLYIRPFLYFGYRYVLRLGFLDGKEGLVFHFMQGLWYRLLVDINRDELAGDRS